MLSHMNRHEEEEEAKVPIIPTATTTNRTAKLTSPLEASLSPDGVDLAEVRGQQQQQYQCTECGDTFRFQSSFLAHRKMHLREKGLTEQEAKSRYAIHCPKSSPNFRIKTQNVEENNILHEIFRMVSHFPRYISETRLPLGQCRS